MEKRAPPKLVRLYNKIKALLGDKYQYCVFAISFVIIDASKQYMLQLFFNNVTVTQEIAFDIRMLDNKTNPTIYYEKIKFDTMDADQIALCVVNKFTSSFIITEDKEVPLCIEI